MRFFLLFPVLLSLTACVSASETDTADTEDTAAPLAVAFDLACDSSSGLWAVTAEVQGPRKAWDLIAVEAHGVKPGEVPLFFSEAHSDSCVTGALYGMDCATTSVQVRVRVENDGATIAQACSARQSAWADCPDTAAPSCPL